MLLQLKFESLTPGGTNMKETQAFFDRYASDFDAIYGTRRSIVSVLNPILRRSMRKRYDKTLQYSQPITGKTALDIGCGPGHYSIAVAELGARRVVGIDFSQAMIALAKGRASSAGVGDKCEFIIGDVLDFCSPEKFDFSIIMGVMDYIDTPHLMIEKIITLTREKAFLSFPASGGLLALQRRIRYRNRCPLYMYSRAQLTALFDGFPSCQYSIEDLGRDYFVTLTLKPTADGSRN